MAIKDDLKVYLNEQIGKKASPIFLKRALTAIEEAPNDKNSLISAAEKVSKMISLFIDKGLASEVLDGFKSKIDKGV